MLATNRPTEAKAVAEPLPSIVMVSVSVARNTSISQISSGQLESGVPLIITYLVLCGILHSKVIKAP
jgi:hypothetical protein